LIYSYRIYRAKQLAILLESVAVEQLELLLAESVAVERLALLLESVAAEIDAEDIDIPGVFAHS
jgi:hypothetical protein